MASIESIRTRMNTLKIVNITIALPNKQFRGITTKMSLISYDDIGGHRNLLNTPTVFRLSEGKYPVLSDPFYL